MAKVTTELSMSLDGYIAHPDDDPKELFDWYAEGDVEIPTAVPGFTFHTSEASARHINENFPKVGCIVAGRRVFDITNGWGGLHPVGGVPVVVVTHRPADEWQKEHPNAPFTFVGDVETGIKTAKEMAGDKNVSVAGPSIIQQVINLGLMEEICISLVPVLIGEGIPFFGALKHSPVKFDGPTIVEGKGVTHLTYTVKR